MKYLIWRNGTLEENLEAFNQLNNLRSLPLTPALEKYALRFSLNYPNQEGTSIYSEPMVCINPNSEYYNAVAMAIFDPMHAVITDNIIQDLISVGVTLPSEGLTPPLAELPADWNSLPVAP